MTKTANIQGYTNCYITSEGEVYNNGCLKTPIIRNGKAPKIRLQENKISKEYGLAKLVAEMFLPNPNQFTKVIFKDGNNCNCKAENLAWVCNREYVRHSLFPGKPLEPVIKESISKIKSAKKPNTIVYNRQSPSHKKLNSNNAIPPPEYNPISLQGFPDYYITTCGKVYSKNKLLTPQKCRNKADRIKVKSSNGVLERHTVAWLMAIAFIPNPNKHPKVVFIDKNKSNCTIENLRWVSKEDYNYFYHSSAEILGPPRPKRQAVVPAWIDPERIPVEDFEGYFISPNGIVYKRNRIIKPKIKKGKSLKVSLVIPGSLPIARKHLGLAKLIAQHFIPNPKKHEYIIFKDRNNQNCCKENIAWVDGETFIYYCGIYHKPGFGKIVLEREEAIRLCTNQLLRNYYETLDTYWLEKSWQDVEERLQGVYKWAACRSDCYMYFIDRANRFSIIKDPAGLLYAYMKGLKVKLKNEISYDIPLKTLLKTDESLRTRELYSNDDNY